MNNHNYSDFPNKTSNLFPKSCWLYLIAYILISVIFLVNFILTYNNFSDNQFIQMNPDLICNTLIKEHNLCLNNYRNKSDPHEIIEECVGANIRLQSCYDKVQIYNEKCFLYFSEFDKCVRDNMKENKKIDFLKSKCESENNDLTQCLAEFISLDTFSLLNLDI
jgi:hypothetical protein